jgi:hypothetical protein
MVIFIDGYDQVLIRMNLIPIHLKMRKHEQINEFSKWRQKWVSSYTIITIMAGML